MLKLVPWSDTGGDAAALSSPNTVFVHSINFAPNLRAPENPAGFAANVTALRNEVLRLASIVERARGAKPSFCIGCGPVDEQPALKRIAFDPEDSSTWRADVKTFFGSDTTGRNAVVFSLKCFFSGHVPADSALRLYGMDHEWLTLRYAHALQSALGDISGFDATEPLVLSSPGSRAAYVLYVRFFEGGGGERDLSSTPQQLSSPLGGTMTRGGMRQVSGGRSSQQAWAELASENKRHPQQQSRDRSKETKEGARRNEVNGSAASTITPSRQQQGRSQGRSTTPSHEQQQQQQRVPRPESNGATPTAKVTAATSQRQNPASSLPSSARSAADISEPGKQLSTKTDTAATPQSTKKAEGEAKQQDHQQSSGKAAAGEQKPQKSSQGESKQQKTAVKKMDSEGTSPTPVKVASESKRPQQQQRSSGKKAEDSSAKPLESDTKQQQPSSPDKKAQKQLKQSQPSNSGSKQQISAPSKAEGEETRKNDASTPDTRAASVNASKETKQQQQPKRKSDKADEPPASSPPAESGEQTAQSTENVVKESARTSSSGRKGGKRQSTQPMTPDTAAPSGQTKDVSDTTQTTAQSTPAKGTPSVAEASSTPATPKERNSGRGQRRGRGSGKSETPQQPSANGDEGKGSTPAATDSKKS